MVQVALEGLLSAACKHHPSCSETQADTQEERLHALRFGADSSETTLVYYTAADQDGAWRTFLLALPAVP